MRYTILILGLAAFTAARPSDTENKVKSIALDNDELERQKSTHNNKDEVLDNNEKQSADKDATTKSDLRTVNTLTNLVTGRNVNSSVMVTNMITSGQTSMESSSSDSASSSGSSDEDSRFRLASFDKNDLINQKSNENSNLRQSTVVDELTRPELRSQNSLTNSVTGGNVNSSVMVSNDVTSKTQGSSDSSSGSASGSSSDSSGSSSGGSSGGSSNSSPGSCLSISNIRYSDSCSDSVSDDTYSDFAYDSSNVSSNDPPATDLDTLFATYINALNKKLSSNTRLEPPESLKNHIKQMNQIIKKVGKDDEHSKTDLVSLGLPDTQHKKSSNKMKVEN